jgi:hypothetical protein
MLRRSRDDDLKNGRGLIAYFEVDDDYNGLCSGKEIEADLNVIF